MNDAQRARELHQAGRLQVAEPLYRAALSAAPEDALLKHDYAVLLMQAGDAARAIALLEAIPEQADCYPQALLALAHCRRVTGAFLAGIETARQVIAYMPESPLAWMLLGSMYMLSGQAVDAESPLQRAVRLAPDFAEAWHYLGEALQAQARYAEAAHAYRQAAKAQPTELFNIGMCAELQGELQQAHTCYQRVLQIMPGRVDVMVRLAHICAQLCRMEAYEKTVAQIAALAHSSKPLPGQASVEPFPLSYLPLPEELKKQLLTAHAERILSGVADMQYQAGVLDELKDRKLRLGYLSPDLGNHAVGVLLQQHFAAHDADAFEVTVYSLRRFNDEVSHTIARNVERFVDVSRLSDQALASRIKADAIDVLIDLGGYTQGARPAALALRPAPVQLGWLGFVHAQQAPWLDGIVLDQWTQPADEYWLYSDKVYAMQSPLLPGHSQQFPVRDRQHFGLPAESTPLLASFNNSYKLDGRLLAAWIRILRALPDARMLVFLRSKQSHQGFLEQWLALGGQREKLLFVDALSADEQMARAACCDLFLDAFQYQAGATAMNSIAAGLPILTLAGTSPVARMSTAINQYLGMDELVVSTVDEYVETAIRLAESVESLADLRQRLLKKTAQSQLFSPRRAAAEIELIALKAYRTKGLA